MFNMPHGAESVSQGHTSSGGSKGESILCFFWFLVTVGLPWLVSHITPIPASITFSYMCLSNLPLLLRPIVMEFKVYRDHPGWISSFQDPLCNHKCKDPFFKQNNICRFQGLEWDICLGLLFSLLQQE